MKYLNLVFQSFREIQNKFFQQLKILNLPIMYIPHLLLEYYTLLFLYDQKLIFLYSVVMSNDIISNFF